jgi:hypothetical protein
MALCAHFELSRTMFRFIARLTVQPAASMTSHYKLQLHKGGVLHLAM